jgi:hypothetical protein
MSKQNVHPDHYKVAGRDRQGEDILQARNRMKFAQTQAQERFETRPTFAKAPVGRPTFAKATAGGQPFGFNTPLTNEASSPSTPENQDAAEPPRRVKAAKKSTAKKSATRRSTTPVRAKKTARTRTKQSRPRSKKATKVTKRTASSSRRKRSSK